MKRYIALFSILVVFASLLVGCDINRMGKDQYYVQITADGIEKNEKSERLRARACGEPIDCCCSRLNNRELFGGVYKNSVE